MSDEGFLLFCVAGFCLGLSAACAFWLAAYDAALFSALCAILIALLARAMGRLAKGADTSEGRGGE